MAMTKARKFHENWLIFVEVMTKKSPKKAFSMNQPIQETNRIKCFFYLVSHQCPPAMYGKPSASSCYSSRQSLFLLMALLALWVARDACLWAFFMRALSLVTKKSQENIPMCSPISSSTVPRAIKPPFNVETANATLMLTVLRSWFPTLGQCFQISPLKYSFAFCVRGTFQATEY